MALPMPSYLDLALSVAAAEGSRIPAFSDSEISELSEKSPLCDTPTEWSAGVAALRLMSPPSGFTASRWAQLVADARVLLILWGTQADRLGWTAYDLFGCHRTRPAARYDCMGLAWLIDGRRVVAMTAGEAVINAQLDHMVTYRRTPLKPEQNLLWQCT